MLPEQAWELIPNNLPDNVNNWIRDFASNAEFNDRERRAFIWASYLLDRVQGFSISTAVTGFFPDANIDGYEISDLSAGFIPFKGDKASTRKTGSSFTGVKSITNEEVNYLFGVVIGINAFEGKNKFEPVAEPSQFITIDGFPVIAEYRVIEEHTPPHPTGVVSTCYAKPLPTKRFFGPRWSDGIVIARHVLTPLGFYPGVSVAMRTGSSMNVVDIDSRSTNIDAAIIDCTTIPSAATPLHLATVAPGSSVEVTTASTSFTGSVLRIYEHPSYFGNTFSHRLFMDSFGVSGDSGSLVSCSTTLKAAGIYIARTTALSPDEGIVQTLKQVAEFFEVELLN